MKRIEIGKLVIEMGWFNGEKPTVLTIQIGKQMAINGIVLFGIQIAKLCFNIMWE